MKGKEKKGVLKGHERKVNEKRRKEERAGKESKVN